jgi:hypothetical protein
MHISGGHARSTTAADPLSPRVQRRSAPQQRNSGERVWGEGWAPWTHVSNPSRPTHSAGPLRCAREARVQAARPSPKPLPAAVLVWRATSYDTRGEGSPAVAPGDAATKCLQPPRSGDRGYKASKPPPASPPLEHPPACATPSSAHSPAPPCYPARAGSSTFSCARRGSATTGTLRSYTGRCVDR